MYAWIVLVGVKQEKLCQGISEKATEMISVLVHLVILLFSYLQLNCPSDGHWDVVGTTS